MAVSQIHKVDLTSPDRGVVARHMQLVLKYTNAGELWRIDTIRLLFSRKAHVLPKWLVRVGMNMRRVKCTLKYTSSEMWKIDSIRLKQKILNKRPQV